MFVFIYQIQRRKKRKEHRAGRKKKDNAEETNGAECQREKTASWLKTLEGADTNADDAAAAAVVVVAVVVAAAVVVVLVGWVSLATAL